MGICLSNGHRFSRRGRKHRVFGIFRLPCAMDFAPPPRASKGKKGLGLHLAPAIHGKQLNWMLKGHLLIAGQLIPAICLAVKFVTGVVAYILYACIVTHKRISSPHPWPNPDQGEPLSQFRGLGTSRLWCFWCFRGSRCLSTGHRKT